MKIRNDVTTINKIHIKGYMIMNSMRRYNTEIIISHTTLGFVKQMQH